MISDTNLRLHGSATAAGAMTLTASTTWYSTNAIDLFGNVPTGGTDPNTNGLQYRDIGEGDDLFAVITIVKVPTGANGATVTCNVIAGTAADGSGTNTILGTTVLSYASSAFNYAAGDQIPIRINPQIKTAGAQYLLMQFVNNGTAMTGSTWASGGAFVDVVTDISDPRKFYASGFKVV